MTELRAADYARAEQMLAHNRERLVPGAKVRPNWFADDTKFWYRVVTRFVVEPERGIRRDAFDHDRLTAALWMASGRAVEGPTFRSPRSRSPMTESSSKRPASVGDTPKWTTRVRRWRDFVRHLLGTEPPAYRLAPFPVDLERLADLLG